MFKPSQKGIQREWFTFALFVTPNLILFAVFTYWPILYSFYLSLREWQLPHAAGEFVGSANFIKLASDGTFLQVIGNTAVYSVSVVLAAHLCAIPLALLLNYPIPARGLFRTLVFLPYVTTTAAAALVWVLLLDPEFGPLATVYHAFDLNGPRWLASSTLALWALVIVGIWREIGIASVFYLAGLQNLPKACYEAAMIDGAGPWSRFVRLTLPLLSPVFFFLALSGFLASVKMFDLVAIMSQGGPVYPASSTYVYHLYRVGFRDFDMGYASAMAIAMFVALLVLTGIQLRLGRRWVHYGS